MEREDGNIKSEKEYIHGKIWNSKQYDINNNLLREVHEGKGTLREYYEFDYEITYHKNNDDIYYYKDILKFDGEILDGKRNGKGKEYNYDGNLIFSGEFINGKKMEYA